MAQHQKGTVPIRTKMIICQENHAQKIYQKNTYKMHTFFKKKLGVG